MTGTAPGVTSQAGSPGGEGKRSLTAAAIAHLIGGELLGDGDVEVTRVAPLDRATRGDVAFLAHARYVADLAAARPGVLLVTPDLAAAPGDAAARVVVADPHGALLRVVPLLYAELDDEPESSRLVHASVVVGEGATLGRGIAAGPGTVIGAGAHLGDDVVVGAQCAIGAGVVVGDGCRLHDSVTLYAGAVLGQRVRVHSGARLGVDGFGYVFQHAAHRKVPHVGRCVIGDDVEIGANTTVDRGSVGDTVIGDGTKVDNLVHVAHNVRIGRRCLIMAQVGIAGSVHVGDDCIIAGQVGISGHVRIGSGVRLAAQAGVFGDVPDGGTWSGYPARPHVESLRASAALFRLAGLVKRLERLVEERG